MMNQRFRLGEDACKPDNGNTARKRAMRKNKVRIPKMSKGKHANHLLSQCLASYEAGWYYVSFRKRPMNHKVFEAQLVTYFQEFTNQVGEFFMEPLEKLQADIQAATQSRDKAKTKKTKDKYQKVIDAKILEFARKSRKASEFTRHSRTTVKASLKNVRLRVLDAKYDKGLKAWIARCEPANLIHYVTIH